MSDRCIYLLGEIHMSNNSLVIIIIVNNNNSISPFMKLKLGLRSKQGGLSPDQTKPWLRPLPCKSRKPSHISAHPTPHYVYAEPGFTLQCAVIFSFPAGDDTMRMFIWIQTRLAYWAWCRNQQYQHHDISVWLNYRCHDANLFIHFPELLLS